MITKSGVRGPGSGVSTAHVAMDGHRVYSQRSVTHLDPGPRTPDLGH